MYIEFNPEKYTPENILFQVVFNNLSSETFTFFNQIAVFSENGIIRYKTYESAVAVDHRKISHVVTLHILHRPGEIVVC